MAPTTVADWAGHSVEVLLKIYAECLDGTDVATASGFRKPSGTGTVTVWAHQCGDLWHVSVGDLPAAHCSDEKPADDADQ